jgi:hypothetical protein
VLFAAVRSTTIVITFAVRFATGTILTTATTTSDFAWFCLHFSTPGRFDTDLIPGRDCFYRDQLLEMPGVSMQFIGIPGRSEKWRSLFPAVSGF